MLPESAVSLRSPNTFPLTDVPESIPSARAAEDQVASLLASLQTQSSTPALAQMLVNEVLTQTTSSTDAQALMDSLLGALPEALDKKAALSLFDLAHIERDMTLATTARDAMSEILANIQGRGAELERTIPTIFGADVPEVAYKALAADLQAGSLPLPEIALSRDLPVGAAAAYDTASQTLLLNPVLLDSPQQIQRAVAEELGHHMDHLLRNHYSDVGGDAWLDEGARFARDVLGLPVADEEIRSDAKPAGLELFEADGHYTVVKAAAREIWDSTEITNNIYFGNWLRDMSNVYDPEGIASIAEKLAPHTMQSPSWLQELGFTGAQPPTLQAVESALTQQLLHFVERGINIEAQARFGREVTAQDIGAYQWVEHIDNPYTSVEEQLKALSPDGVSMHMLASRDRMIEMLHKAYAAGLNAEGFKLLGDATHTLEDLFAHSNFTEIVINQALASSGSGDRVLTWAPTIEVGNSVRPILTTGGFGDTDVGYSLAPALAKAVFPPAEEASAHDHTLEEAGAALKALIANDANAARPTLSHADKILEILAEEQGIEHMPALLDAKNRLTQVLAPIKSLSPEIYQDLMNAIDAGGNRAVNGAAEIIPLMQSVGFNPNERLPSHSQLAKDHTDHPLHKLSHSLAIVASKDVMRSMKEAWDYQQTGDIVHADKAMMEAVAKVNGYFTYPSGVTGDMNIALVDWMNKVENLPNLERSKFQSKAHQILTELPGMNVDLADEFLKKLLSGEFDRQAVSPVEDYARSVLDDWDLAIKEQLKKWEVADELAD